MTNSLRRHRGMVFSIVLNCLAGLLSISAAQDKELIFSVIGDIPYTKKEVKVLRKHVSQHNLYSPSEFLVHVGDIRGTSSGCKESEYETVSSIFLESDVPVYVIPGDNEWTDCKDPKKGWSWWSKYFFDFEQNFCGSPSTQRQSIRRENFAFVKNGVLMIGVNMIGGSKDKGKKARLKQNGAWVTQQFAEKGTQVRAAVVFGHALSGSDKKFKKTFFKDVRAFGKPVVYIQGQDHSWQLKKSFMEKNLTKVTVDKGRSALPLQVTVTLDEKDPFRFDRKPWSSKKSKVIARSSCSGSGDSSSGSTLTVQPGSHNYGKLTVHTSSRQAFSLTNSADSDIVVSSVQITGGDADQFALESSWPFVLAKGQAEDLVVSFNPTAAGSRTATLRIESDDSTNSVLEVGLQGSGKGLPGSASQLTFTPVADTYVRSSEPEMNKGTARSFQVVRKPSSMDLGYLKFEASGLPGAVQSARVVLTAAAGSKDGGSIYLVSNDFEGTGVDWGEKALTWSNAPVINGAPLSSVGKAEKGKTVEFDVSAGVSGDGVYSFAIKNNSSDRVKYNTKEKGSNVAPRLVIDLVPRPAPVVDSFSPSKGKIGTTVTVKGLNFDGTTYVAFDGAAAAGFSVISDTELVAELPAGATSGKIAVANIGGAGASDDVFQVEAERTITHRPTDDTYIRSTRPNDNFGADRSLHVKAGKATYDSYLKFVVSGINGVVKSAKVRLKVNNDSDEGGSIYLVSNNYDGDTKPWTEKKLTWTNAPAISGTPLSSLGAVADDQVVEFDVASAIASNGTYSFAIRSGSGDRVKYETKEKKGGLAPELVIETVGIAKRSEAASGYLAAETPSENLPQTVSLSSIYPNPFNLEATIDYALPKAAEVRMVVFNIRGQEVRTIVDGVQKAGFHKARWDGKDGNGSIVASGPYVVRMAVGQQRFSRKLTLMK